MGYKVRSEPYRTSEAGSDIISRIMPSPDSLLQSSHQETFMMKRNICMIACQISDQNMSSTRSSRSAVVVSPCRCFAMENLAVYAAAQIVMVSHLGMQTSFALPHGASPGSSSSEFDYRVFLKAHGHKSRTIQLRYC
jgi:hypothetical protein